MNQETSSLTDRVRFFSRNFIKRIIYYFSLYTQHQVILHSATTSLFMIISLFPFTMLFLTLIQYLPISKDYLFLMLEGLVPEELTNLLHAFIDQIYQIPSGTFSFSLITAFWSGSTGVVSICNGLNQIYGLTETRPWIVRRLHSILYTLLIMLLFVASLFLLVFGTRMEEWISTALPFIDAHMDVFSVIRFSIAIILLLTIFLVIYSLFPDEHHFFLLNLPGAIFSTVGWTLFSFVYSYYVSNFSSYSVMYGSMAIIVISVLWLYISMNIIFIGGEVNQQFLLFHRRRRVARIIRTRMQPPKEVATPEKKEKKKPAKPKAPNSKFLFYQHWKEAHQLKKNHRQAEKLIRRRIQEEKRKSAEKKEPPSAEQ